MSSKIYKYMGAKVLELALSTPGSCSFKCSYPKDFNDPYELFLTIDFEQAPDILATYKDTIGEMPQLPTTCFSKSPSVVPMWAHYSHDHRGVVVEFNEELFLETFPDIWFDDVKYSNEASDGLLQLAIRACQIGKPRYHYMLQQGVLNTAYFSKHTCWEYEQERRMVARQEHIKNVNGNMLIEFPVECISSIIIGIRTDDQTKKKVSDLAIDIGADVYEMRIGKTSAEPFFIDTDDCAHHHTVEGITLCEFVCFECGEPIPNPTEKCSFCAIEKYHERDAAIFNPLRMFQRYGHLDEYYEKMNSVGKKK